MWIKESVCKEYRQVLIYENFYIKTEYNSTLCAPKKYLVFFLGGGGVLLLVLVLGGGVLGSSASFVFSSLEVAVASPNNLHHCAEVTCL